MIRREKEILKLCLMTVMDEEQKGTASYRDAHNYIVNFLSKNNTYIDTNLTIDRQIKNGNLTALEKDLIEVCVDVLNDNKKIGTINYKNAQEYIISIAVRCKKGEL